MLIFSIKYDKISHVPFVLSVFLIQLMYKIVVTLKKVVNIPVNCCVSENAKSDKNN